MQPLPLNPIVEQGILFSTEVISGPNKVLYFVGLTMIITGGCIAVFAVLGQVIKRLLP